MAEFLIRVVDKVQPDVQLSKISSKSGDVISVCADGWAWSQAELTNPEWRIVSVSVLQSTIDAALAPDIDAPTGNIRRRRLYYVDFTQAPDPSLFSGARTQAIITLTRQQANRMITQKPPA